MNAYITATAATLPGPAVSNDEIEDVLGVLPSGRSRLKRRILRNNGIQARHYAIDRETGRPTHTSAQLAADAIRGACERGGVALDAIELLACAASNPDQLMPGHASMVHGELGGGPCEIVSTHGICCAGVTALKYAAMAVAAGDARSAVASAVERPSAYLRADHFSAEFRARREADESDPYIGFDQEFLRWMLSDGSGALLLSDRPAASGLSLRVEWIDLLSFAGELPTCMYMGGERTEDGSITSWHDAPAFEESVRRGHFNLHQDVKVLGRSIIDVSVTRMVESARRRRGLTPDDIDWILPHYSSEFFREKSHQALLDAEFPIPYERWCSNLVERGNTGCASIFIMMDDFLASGRLREGDGVLLSVPESGRFSSAWAFLRAVAP